MIDPNQKTEEQELADKLKERFAELPQAVQAAITSVDVQKSMRALAEKHNLHLDKWELLETEVMLTLYGFQPAEELEKNIREVVELHEEEAHTIVGDINEIVFEPIRAELERELGHPLAEDKEVSDVEKVRIAALAEERKSVIPPPPVAPGTPPQPKPEQAAIRGPASGAYVPGETSAARKNVIDDPYRIIPE